MVKGLLGVLVVTVCIGLQAQDIVGVSTVWSDSFREWEYLTPDEYRSGRLYMRWPSNDDWTQWDFRMGDTTAEMRLMWRDNPNEWQIRCLGVTVSARTVWPGQFNEWRLQDDTHKLVIKTRFGNLLDQWELRSDTHGTFNMHTYWENDPRDWVVEDGLDTDVSYAMRLALIFIATYHSTPKI